MDRLNGSPSHVETKRSCRHSYISHEMDCSTGMARSPLLPSERVRQNHLNIPRTLWVVALCANAPTTNMDLPYLLYAALFQKQRPHLALFRTDLCCEGLPSALPLGGSIDSPQLVEPIFYVLLLFQATRALYYPQKIRLSAVHCSRRIVDCACLYRMQ